MACQYNTNRSYFNVKPYPRGLFLMINDEIKLKLLRILNETNINTNIFFNLARMTATLMHKMQ